MNSSLPSHSFLAVLQEFQRKRGKMPGAFAGRPGPATIGLILLLFTCFGFVAAHAQDEHKRKIPVVDKITGGSNRQAFSGKVESLDLERHVLEVNASEGKTMEIFPVKKGIIVSSAAGEKMRLEQLKQGTNVIIYYEQKGDKRTVKEIVVLAAASDKDHEKSSPPS